MRPIIGVNGDCLSMAMWGRMPLPPIPICPQEPWEAQEYAHRDRSRVKFLFCGRPGVETRLQAKRTIQEVGPKTKSNHFALSKEQKCKDPIP